MTRNSNIAVVTIGSYTKVAFEDRAQAMRLVEILGDSVQVTDHVYELTKYDQPHAYFLAESDSLCELKFAPQHQFNTSETIKEAKARLDREKQDREDMNQEMREAPAALPAPTPFDDDLSPF